MADALDRMAVPALLVDRGGTLTHVNRSAVATLNLPVDAAGGPLAAVLADWQGVGGLGAAVDGTVADAVRISSGTRVLDCASRPLAGGGAVVTMVDISGHARAVEEAKRDTLTGLFDRSSLHARLERALAEPNRAGWALLCIDLDRFKAVNDTLGHAVGDALLRKIADSLRRAHRA